MAIGILFFLVCGSLVLNLVCISELQTIHREREQQVLDDVAFDEYYKARREREAVSNVIGEVFSVYRSNIIPFKKRTLFH